MASARDLARVQKQVWHGSVPLEIRLAPAECRTYTESDAYLIQAPRLSYLPFLLPRLHAFFAPALIDPSVPPSAGWFSVDDAVPLKWHHPLGLLYDLYAGAEPYNTLPPASPPPSFSDDDSDSDSPSDEAAAASGSASPHTHPLPWRLTLSYAPPPSSLLPLDPDLKAMHDAFVNAVKEADFLRNGSAKAAMSLSKADSDALWAALQAHERAPFAAVNARLVNPPGVVLRHVPLKIYLPAAPAAPAPAANDGAGAPSPSPSASASASASGSAPNPPRTLRVVQAPVPPRLTPSSSSSSSSSTASSKQPQTQTLGTALHGLLPSLFPSRRSALLAQPVLHGAVVPLGAPLEELGRAASYADGFLHVVVGMMG